MRIVPACVHMYSAQLCCVIAQGKQRSSDDTIYSTYYFFAIKDLLPPQPGSFSPTATAASRLQ